MTYEFSLQTSIESSTECPVIVRAPRGRATPVGALFFAGTLLAGASGATYAASVDVSRLNASSDSSLLAVRDRDDHVSLADVMAEIKLRSGLTWEELSRIFSVSRKTVHNWAAGGAITEAHRESVQKLFDTLSSLANLRSFEIRRLLLKEAGVADLPLPDSREAPVLFADQSPSAARLNVRRGGMKIARRNGASG